LVILGKWAGRSITLSVKASCLTISTESGSQAEVFSYDYEGRFWTGMLEGVSYRRGLDGKIVAKWQLPEGERGRRWLQPDEALEIEGRGRETASELWEALQQGDAHLHTPLPPLGLTGFERAIAFDEGRSRADVARYHQVYRTVGILPPDQYMAVVLQATLGCAFNTCTFCDFYRDRPFRIKNPVEFAEHAKAVRDFLAEGLSLRRTIFLGDANALIAPMSRLVPLLETVHQVYEVDKLGGMFAFLDGFSGGHKTAADYRVLVGLGLKRAYVGLESGHDPLLKQLKKPGSTSDAIQAVNAMKAGGVAVGVIVLLGAGGLAYERQHVADTIRALNSMHLDMEDIIYFSELIEGEDLDYTRDAYQGNWQPLLPEQRIAQGERIEAALLFSDEGGVPHISRYDIREFVY
jgi:hypothetical protein